MKKRFHISPNTDQTHAIVVNSTFQQYSEQKNIFAIRKIIENKIKKYLLRVIQSKTKLKKISKKIKKQQTKNTKKRSITKPTSIKNSIQQYALIKKILVLKLKKEMLYIFN
eukprot:TRINITY_DN962_c0_g1_i6.p4 TRINITY_DN962_c0_g1~~TRINITY_DN962_c0_g1_i6.p4  ORF type:complete len:111 (-),score=3.60 TRINITY_DN962_c0_g1_i6:723-1055(-)